MMNSRETIRIDAETNSSYDHDNKKIYHMMNNNNNNHRNLYEKASTILQKNNYFFEPINHEFTSHSTAMQTTNSHLIQRPIPIANHYSNSLVERTKKQLPHYASQTKRNSTINVNPTDTDSTVQPRAFPRSMTSEQLTKHTTTNKHYYYPSVQDVLDALNRRAFDKESFV